MNVMADRRTDFVASAGAAPSPLEEVPMFLPSRGTSGATENWLRSHR